MIRGFLVGVFLFCSLGWAQERPLIQPDWDPSTVVPEVTIMGSDLSEDLAHAGRVRAHLIENLEYWRSHGLPQPKAMTQIIYLADPAQVGFADMLSALNPEIEDIKTTIREQQQAFRESVLWLALEQIEKRTKSKPGSWRKSVFDAYVFSRYGFTVEGALLALLENRRLSKCKPGALVPIHDNAFYARSHAIDLSEVLTPADRNPRAQEILASQTTADLMKQVSLSMFQIGRLERALESPKAKIRIIILPRSTQNAQDVELSTFRDLSIIAHEQGHHINHSLSTSRTLERLIDEVMADYIAASPVDDPRIGQYFARASALIAERLKQDAATNEDKALAERLEAVSERGVIRDLRKSMSIDDLARSQLSSDPYTSGTPVRAFLWNLHLIAEEKGIIESFDAMVLESLRRFSELPGVMSPRTMAALQIRQHWQQVKQAAVALVLGKPRAQTYALQQERLSRSLRKFWQIFGWGSRPAIEADYIIPEYFRAFYRAAALRTPELLEEIRLQAEEAMNSSSAVVTLEDGSQDLVFIRTTVDRHNLVAQRKLKVILENLKIARTNVQEALAANIPAAVLKPMVMSYHAELERLQEYERTGSTFRLFFAKPWYALSMTTTRAGIHFIRSLIKPKPEMLNDCEHLLMVSKP